MELVKDYLSNIKGKQNFLPAFYYIRTFIPLALIQH